MFTQSLLKVGVAAIFSVGFMACSQNSSANNDDQLEGAVASADYTPGTVAHTSKVVGTSEVPVGTASSKEEIYAMFPQLQKNASELLSIDRVVETNAHNWELYSGSNLMIVLGSTASGLTVIHSSSGFQAELITLTAGCRF